MIVLVLAMIAALPGLWPFGPYQLSLILARRLWRFPPLPPATARTESETFAVCLCAYNEKAVIRDKVEDLLQMRAAAGGNLDILIYVDAASDGTSEILEEYRERIKLHVSPDRHGKTYGMNLLVSMTDASIIMFTDANVLIDPTAVEVLRRYYSDPSIGCVCSTLNYVNAGSSATAAVGAAYWQLNEWTKGLETATGSVIGADGSLFSIRRSLHRQVPKGLFDDLYVSVSILLQGYRVVSAPELLAYETHSTETADEYRRKVRIACECMACHFTLWPEVRRLDAWNLYKYVTHRLFRWVGGYSLALSALLFCMALARIVGMLPAAILIILAALGFWLALRAKLGIAGKIWNAVVAFAGNSVGVWRACRGMRAVTWSSPESARRAKLHR